jgi:hypothetical protein
MPQSLVSKNKYLWEYVASIFRVEEYAKWEKNGIVIGK